MEKAKLVRDGHFINRTPPLETECPLSYNTLIHKSQMPDDLQREEELFFKALEEYKEKKSQEPTDKTTNTLPAVIAAVL